MQTKDLKYKVLKSNTILEIAQDTLVQAGKLPDDDPKKQQLMDDAQNLFEKAKKLTSEARSEVSKLSSSLSY